MKMDDNSFWFLIILLFAIWWNVDEYISYKKYQIEQETYTKIEQLNTSDRQNLKEILEKIEIQEKEK